MNGLKIAMSTNRARPWRHKKESQTAGQREDIELNQTVRER